MLGPYHGWGRAGGSESHLIAQRLAFGRRQRVKSRRAPADYSSMELQTASAQTRDGIVASSVESARVSVIIPAYNAASHLPATLKSVLGQSARPGEVIVIDDGSADDTAAIAAGFGVRVLSRANAGCAAARNAGIEHASGEYIAFMDADDLWHPHKLAVQLAALQSYPGPAFSFTDYRWFDEQGVHERSSGLRRHPAFRRVANVMGTPSARGDILIAADGKRPVLPDCYIQPSSLLVRRADVIAVGGFDERVRLAEDYEFFLRLFRIEPAIAVMQSLLLYRRHATQITANQTIFQAGLFDLARHVAASPERYPIADVRYMANAAYLRHYRLGVQHARLENVDDAARSFAQSFAARPTVRAALALTGATLCRSTPGRRSLHALRTLWKRRPKTPSR
jgi:glycosyltransferase involved in cell wall biosynthesis